MGKYCDSEQLELHWFLWLLAENAPALEEHRKLGVLWTRPKDVVASTFGKHLPSPISRERHYCVVHGSELRFFDHSSGDSFDFDLPRQPPTIAEDCLTNWGFVKEIPIADSWRYLGSDISLMCSGIASNFHQSSDDLAHEAFLQTMTKIKLKKLVYLPGKAPVFNLLTTAITRTCCSVMNQQTRRIKNAMKLHQDIQNGRLKPIIKSLGFVAVV
jgi:hypothetical protein